jgi:hypothetical protein
MFCKEKSLIIFRQPQGVCVIIDLDSVEIKLFICKVSCHLFATTVVSSAFLQF